MKIGRDVFGPDYHSDLFFDTGGGYFKNGRCVFENSIWLSWLTIDARGAAVYFLQDGIAGEQSIVTVRFPFGRFAIGKASGLSRAVVRFAGRVLCCVVGRDYPGANVRLLQAVQ